MATPAPDWKEVQSPTPVFRFVAAADDATPRSGWFLSDNEAAAQKGERPRANRIEKEHPDLLDGMSVYRTRDDAQAEWDAVRAKAAEREQPMRLPESIAEVMLDSGCGVALDDRGEAGGHLYAKGASDAFVPLVKDVRLGADQSVRLYP